MTKVDQILETEDSALDAGYSSTFRPLNELITEQSSVDECSELYNALNSIRLE